MRAGGRLVAWSETEAEADRASSFWDHASVAFAELCAAGAALVRVGR